MRAVAAAQGGGPGSESAAISPDGRYVEFVTGGRLAASDTDVLGDAYLYDRRRGSAQVVSPGPLDCFHGGILGLTRTPATCSTGEAARRACSIGAAGGW